MKNCPHCEAELKDSVIRCVRCGRSLREEPERETVSASVGSGATGGLPSAPTPQPSAPPVSAAKPRPAGFASPVVTPPPNLKVVGDRSQLRALPSRRAWGPDWFMLLGGLMAMAAGTIAYLAIERPWVHLSITQTDIDGQELLSTGLSLRGKAAPVIDGLSGDQRFFLGWARIWRELVRPEYARQLAISNPYPAGAARANGPVRQIAAFREAFPIR